GEAFMRDVRARDRREDVARTRSPEPERAPRGRDVVQCSGAVRREVVLEPLAVAWPVEAARDDAEEVVAKPHDRQVGLEAAVLVEERGVDDTVDGDVHL